MCPIAALLWIFSHTVQLIFYHTVLLCALLRQSTPRKHEKLEGKTAHFTPLKRDKNSVWYFDLNWKEANKNFSFFKSTLLHSKFCLSFLVEGTPQTKAFTDEKEAHPIKPSNTCGYCVWNGAQLRGSASRSHSRRPPTAPRRSRTALKPSPGSRLYTNS